MNLQWCKCVEIGDFLAESIANGETIGNPLHKNVWCKNFCWNSWWILLEMCKRSGLWDKPMSNAKQKDHAKYAEWTRLPVSSTVQPDPGCKTVALSDTEFAMSTRSLEGQHREYAVMRYNSITNQWNKLAAYHRPEKALGVQETFCMDHVGKKLFLFQKAHKRAGGKRFTITLSVITFNIATNQRETLCDDCKVIEKNNKNGRTKSSHIVFANGVCHRFISYDIFRKSNLYLKHFILDQDAGSFSEINDFTMDSTKHCFISQTFFVSKLNTIYFILYEYTSKSGYILGLELETNQWTKHKEAAIRFNPTSVTLTFDEKYVVMTNTEKIFLMDISNENHFTLLESNICPPTSTAHYSLVRTGGGIYNEKLVIGWTKRLFQDIAFKELSLPPLYLLQMIAYWVSSEEIHHLPRGMENESLLEHYVMSMKRILANVHELNDVG